MSLFGHRTPDAACGYIKKTDAQRFAANWKRRAWVHELGTEAGMEAKFPVQPRVCGENGDRTRGALSAFGIS